MIAEATHGSVWHKGVSGFADRGEWLGWPGKGGPARVQRLSLLFKPLNSVGEHLESIGKLHLPLANMAGTSPHFYWLDPSRPHQSGLDPPTHAT